MKRAAWLPAVVAIGLEATIVLAALFVRGSGNVFHHFLGVATSALGLLFLAYCFHFLGQQDFIGGGCRPYAIDLLGGFVMLLGFMLGVGSVFSFFFSAMELFSVSGITFPLSLWFVIIGGHATFYAALLYSSRLKAKEDETIFVNGRALKQSLFFFGLGSLKNTRFADTGPSIPLPQMVSIKTERILCFGFPTGQSRRRGNFLAERACIQNLETDRPDKMSGWNL